MAPLFVALNQLWPYEEYNSVTWDYGSINIFFLWPQLAIFGQYAFLSMHPSTGNIILCVKINFLIKRIILFLLPVPSFWS